MEPWVVIVTIVGGVLGGTGGAEIIKAVAKRRPRAVAQAESDIALARQAQLYAQQVEEDATEARRAAREAWQHAAEAQRKIVGINHKLDNVVRETNRLAVYVERLVHAIIDRGMTIDRLRIMVENDPPPIPRDSSLNGR